MKQKNLHSLLWEQVEAVMHSGTVGRDVLLKQKLLEMQLNLPPPQSVPRQVEAT